MSVIEVSRPRPGIVQLTLNRPEKLNAMTTELVEGLHRLLDEIAVDPRRGWWFSRARGRGSAAGLDLGGYGSAPDTSTSVRHSAASRCRSTSHR